VEKAFALKQRFGLNAEELIAKDLTIELNSEISTQAVKQAYLNAIGVTQWQKTPPAGVSYIEHQLTFMNTLAQAEAQILSNAGRLNNTALLVGGDAAAIIRALPGFQPAPEMVATLGTHFFGTLDGKPVLRSSVVPDAEMLMISKGTSMFDTSLVYAPYLPLFVTNMTDGIDHNPLKSQKGVALQAGMIAPVPTLITKITIVA